MRGTTGAYVAASLPVRLVADGAQVALALAAVEALHDLALGAVLIAAFTAPSVVAAPVVGAALDAVRSPRRLMAAGAVVLAATFAVTAFLGPVPVPVVIVALVIGGCTLPLFMGGLSSFAADLFAADAGRGFAIDALSYNTGAVAGPAVVAGLAGLLGPTVALLVLAAVTALGAVLLAGLPLVGRGGAGHPRALLAGVRAGLHHLAAHRPLARATTASTLTQVGGGALPVVVIALSLARGGDAAGGGWLLTAFAVGGVLGAGLGALPPVTRLLATRRAEVVMAAGFAATGVLTGVAAVVPGYALTAVALLLAGVPDAPAVAALFRIRRAESPVAVRAQVFTIGAGLRVAAAAVGALLAGLAARLDPALLTLGVATVWIASAALAIRRGASADDQPDPTG